jgi:hypothetical protein
MNENGTKSQAQIQAEIYDRLLLDKTVKHGAHRLMLYPVKHGRRSDSYCWPERRRTWRPDGFI